MKVSGAVGLVTGGASGLGRGVVEMLVARGARAVIADLEGSPGQELADRLGDNVRFVACDVTQPTMVGAAVSAAVSAFGRIDVLVSCAGISVGARVVGRGGVLHSLELFRKHVDVNLVGMFDMVRHVAGVMATNEPGIDGERGLIVNIASIAGYEGQVGQVAYGSSKGGVVAMTLPLARDLGGLGIRVMCICPGTMDTPLLAGLSREFVDRLADDNVFPKRLGVPADLASLVAQLMENTYFNGEVIRLDAGLRLAPRRPPPREDAVSRVPAGGGYVAAVPRAETVLDAATSIAARARSAADEIETTQRLPADLVRDMSAAGLFQMYVRPSVGGPGHDPLTAYRAVEILARADASTAWLAMVSSGTTWLTGWVPEDVLRSMCGTRCDLRLAGSARPLGRATRVAGGYRVSGRWNFASGIMHANWVIAGALIDDAAMTPPMRIMLLPVDEVSVEHTWSVVGMRGTGSHDIVIDDVFVPEAHAVIAIGPALSGEAIYSQRLLRVCNFAPTAGVLIGAATGAIDDVIAMADRPTTLNSVALRDRPEMQRCIADSTARIDSARAYISEVVADAYDAVCGDRDPTAAVAASLLSFAHAAQQATLVIGELTRTVGTPAAHLSNPLQRRARDVMVAQHFPSFDISTYENAGRVLLGLESNESGW